MRATATTAAAATTTEETATATASAATTTGGATALLRYSALRVRGAERSAPGRFTGRTKESSACRSSNTASPSWCVRGRSRDRKSDGSSNCSWRTCRLVATHRQTPGELKSPLTCSSSVVETAPSAPGEVLPDLRLRDRGRGGERRERRGRPG